jgi:RNA polymerase sigma factor (sigma-70 family)
MYNESVIATASDAGLDSIVLTCCPDAAVLTTAVAMPPDLPFPLLAKLLGEETVVRVLQLCLCADPRTPKQEAAVGWFWGRFQPFVRQEVNAFCRRAKFRAELDDLCQEVWIEMSDALPELKYEPMLGSLSGWMCVVTRRTVGRAMRHAVRLDPPHCRAIDDVGTSLRSPDLGPAEVCLLRELQEQMDAVLHTLEQRTSSLNFKVFHRRFVGHQSIKEIAADLGLSQKAVQCRYGRMMRAFRRLAKHFGVSGGDSYSASNVNPLSRGSPARNF